MKKKLWLIAAVIIVVLFAFAGCIDVSTHLDIQPKDGDFSGKREVTVAFDTAIAENNLEYGVEDLDRYIKKYMPEQFDKFERTDKYNPTEYVFTISFSSLAEYERKIEAIIGRDVNISCEYSPTDVFTGSASLSEDFTSIELFNWVEDAVKDAGFADKINTSSGVSGSDTQTDFSDAWNNSGASVVIGDRTFTITTDTIDVSSGHGDIVESIAAELLINEDGSYSSLVVFTFGQLETQELEAVFEYFNTHTPEGASVEQTSSSNSTVFSIAFDCADATELYLANSTVFGELCSVSVSDYTDPARPMAKLTAFDAKIDLSIFSSDGSVNFSYTVNSTGGVPIAVIDLSDGGEAEYDLRGSSAIITGSEEILDLRIILESLETSNGIDYNLVMLDDEHFVREIKIYLDSENATATLEQVAAYFKGKNAANTTVEIVVPDETTPYVALVIEGTPAQITLAEDTLFGTVEGRKLSYERQNQKLITKLLDIRPDSVLVDNFDISALLSITNTNSFVYTFVSEKDKVYEAGSKGGVSNSDLATKAISLQLSGGVHQLSFRATYFNLLALVFICLQVILLILVFALIITVIQNRRQSEEERLLAIEESESFALPEYKSEGNPFYAPSNFFNESENESNEIRMNDPYAMGGFESISSDDDNDIPGFFSAASFQTEESDNSVIPMPAPVWQDQPEPEKKEEPVQEVIEMPAPQPQQVSEAIPMPAPSPAPTKEEDPFFEDYEDRFPMENLPEFVKASDQPDDDEQYSNRDFIEDLKFLGYLDDYKNRSTQKVKVKVKRRSDAHKEW